MGKPSMTQEIADAIRKDRADDPTLTYPQLAERHGVSKEAVKRVMNGRSFAPKDGPRAQPPHAEPVEARGGAAAVHELPIAHIGAGNNPRGGIDDMFDLDELVASIAAHGVIEPVIVRRPTHPADSGGRQWQLVAGERRWRAANKAGLQTIPAIVRELDDGDALEVALIENLQRRDMHPLDEARAFKRLKRLGRSTGDIATRVGRTERHVQKRLQVAERLPERAKVMLRKGTMSLAQGEALAEAPAGADAEMALDMIEAGQLRTEADLRAFLTPKRPDTSGLPEPAQTPAPAPSPPAPSPQTGAGGSFPDSPEAAEAGLAAPPPPGPHQADAPTAPHPEEPASAGVSKDAPPEGGAPGDDDDDAFVVIFECDYAGGDVRGYAQDWDGVFRQLLEPPYNWDRITRIAIERSPEAPASAPPDEDGLEIPAFLRRRA